LPRFDERKSPLLDLADRFGELSDALHAPDGLVHRLFAGAETQAAERHKEVMTALRHLSDGLLDVSGRLAKLEPEAERHEARLTLLESNGNGADHG